MIHPLRTSVWLRRLALASIFATWGLYAQACSVPVFRYALERWPASTYECLVFHSGPLKPEDSPALRRLQDAAEGKQMSANVGVTLVDVKDPKLDEGLRKLWEKHKAAAEKAGAPWMAVLYPPEARIEKELWAGVLTEKAVDMLLVSPVRTELAKRILSGDSVVWLLIESGDAAKDKAAAKVLEEATVRLGKELKLPEIEAEDQRFMTATQPPLKLAFSVLRLRRNDPAEEMLVRTLLGEAVLGDQPPPKGPVVVPIIGRGRAAGMIGGEPPPAPSVKPEAPAGKGERDKTDQAAPKPQAKPEEEAINPEIIEDAARFLTGECSCTIKEQMRGLDLLISADWEGLISGRITLAESLPKLTTTAALAEAKQVLTAAEAKATLAAEAAAAAAGVPEVRPAAADPAGANDPMVRNLIIAGAIALGVVAGGIASILVRRPKPE